MPKIFLVASQGEMRRCGRLTGSAERGVAIQRSRSIQKKGQGQLSRWVRQFLFLCLWSLSRAFLEWMSDFGKVSFVSFLLPLLAPSCSCPGLGSYKKYSVSQLICTCLMTLCPPYYFPPLLVAGQLGATASPPLGRKLQASSRGSPTVSRLKSRDLFLKVRNMSTTNLEYFCVVIFMLINVYSKFVSYEYEFILFCQSFWGRESQ